VSTDAILLEVTALDGSPSAFEADRDPSEL
jgi:hypothetical protein